MKTTDAFERLSHALSRMDDLYARLLELGDAEQQAMVSLDTPGVHATVTAQEELLPRLAAAEEARQAAVADLVRSGAAREGDGLADLADAAPAPVGDRLRELRESLGGRARDLARQTALNRSLCEQALDHVSEVVRLMTGGDDQTYQRPGGTEEPGNRSAGPRLVDRTA